MRVEPPGARHSLTLPLSLLYGALPNFAQHLHSQPRMSTEWKVVQRKNNRGSKQQNANTDTLVKEILTALLANWAYQPKAREPEWK